MTERFQSPVSKVHLYFLTFRRIVFALATHWNGRGFLLFSRMYSWIAWTRSRTERNVPRRMGLRVISANQRSTWFSQEALVGESERDSEGVR